MSELSDLAAMALRSIIKRANQDLVPDEWTSAYFYGQVAIVEGYMEPSTEQLVEAKRAVDQLKARQHGAQGKETPM